MATRQLRSRTKENSPALATAEEAGGPVVVARRATRSAKTPSCASTAESTRSTRAKREKQLKTHEQTPTAQSRAPSDGNSPPNAKTRPAKTKTPSSVPATRSSRRTAAAGSGGDEAKQKQEGQEKEEEENKGKSEADRTSESAATSASSTTTTTTSSSSSTTTTTKRKSKATSGDPLKIDVDELVTAIAATSIVGTASEPATRLASRKNSETDEANESDASDTEKDSNHWRATMETEKSKLLELSGKWEAVLAQAEEKKEGREQGEDNATDDDDDDNNVPDSACGHIRSAIGQAQLLVRKRFKQYGELCDLSKEKQATLKAKANDLAGFWEVIMFQVSDVYGRFAMLEEIKSNAWQEPQSEEIKPKRVAVGARAGGSSAKAAKKKGSAAGAKSATATAAAVAREAARKKRLQETKARMKAANAESASAGGSSSGDVKIFAGPSAAGGAHALHSSCPSEGIPSSVTVLSPVRTRKTARRVNDLPSTTIATPVRRSTRNASIETTLRTAATALGAADYDYAPNEALRGTDVVPAAVIAAALDSPVHPTTPHRHHPIRSAFHQSSSEVVPPESPVQAISTLLSNTHVSLPSTPTTAAARVCRTPVRLLPTPSLSTPLRRVPFTAQYDDDDDDDDNDD